MAGAPPPRPGVEDPDTQRGIVRLLIDRLYELLQSIAADDEAKAVYVVDARGAMPSIDDWADEIHGNDDGFAESGCALPAAN